MMRLNLLNISHAKDDGKQVTQYLASISGIYQGWPSPSLVKILSNEYPIEVTEEEASYIAVIGSIGHVFAAFLAASLSDWIGRKNTILCIALPQIASFSLISFSYHSKILLYFAQVLAGMGEGASFAVVPSYIAEISEPNIRGTLGTYSTLAMTFGTLFINTIGTYLSIPMAALICHAFPILFLLTFSSMPESPYYCLMKNNSKEAHTNLQILRRSQNITEEIKEISQAVKRQMSERGTFKDLFMVDSNRKAFIIATAARIFQAYTGVAAITAYTQIIILQNTNFSALLGSTMIFAGKLVAIMVSFTYIDRIGRKPMFALCCLGCALILYAQAIFLTIKDYTNINMESILWVPVLLILLWNIVFAGGLASGVNIYIGEIFSTSIKAKAMSASGVTFALTFMSTVKIFQYTSDNIGAAVPFYIFATFSLVGTMYLAFVIPETKGKTLETIQQELKGNLE
ncbi:unnamed protein product [Ceutorhynchus assimilis]|uniref:Major facilitator superfamily (MFS) profile domain-containing protein n=1 Tax=Ceutorhynchus assimilis TaxID=467358 RepID=A0A9N9QK51_9CUCU|nr:unnamed protein product [Ceutorhynchus assimilis]